MSLTPMAEVSFPPATSRLSRIRRRQGWLLGVTLLLVALVGLRAMQIPAFGGFELRAIVAGTFSLALLSMAQAVVVISGGINIAVGALMVFANCLSARLMEGQGVLACFAITVFTIAVCVAISAIMGWLVTLSGVPDIVVTLALSFVIGGMALMVMPTPGGGTAKGFQPLIVGSFSDPIPSALWIIGILAVVWLPFRRSRWGIATYAVGGDRKAAYLAGVSVAATRIRAYTISGIFVGLAGVVATAFTGSGNAQLSTGLAVLLSSVAAVVLGGVALLGGRGGLIGPVIAAFIFNLIPAIMLGFGWDPNLAQVAQGTILILVVMIGALIQVRGRAS